MLCQLPSKERGEKINEEPPPFFYEKPRAPTAGNKRDRELLLYLKMVESTCEGEGRKTMPLPKRGKTLLCQPHSHQLTTLGGGVR